MDLFISVLASLIPVSFVVGFTVGKVWSGWRKHRAQRHERRLQLRQRKDWLRSRAKKLP